MGDLEGAGLRENAVRPIGGCRSCQGEGIGKWNADRHRKRSEEPSEEVFKGPLHFARERGAIIRSSARRNVVSEDNRIERKLGNSKRWDRLCVQSGRRGHYFGRGVSF